MKYKSVILCIALLSFSLFYCDGFAFAGTTTDLKGFYKADYMPEDVVTKGVDPNVMLLLDTSTAMTFTLEGVMPYKTDFRDIYQRAALLAQSTYGHGMRPPVIDGEETTQIRGGSGMSLYSSFSRYGRDLDSSNNYIGSADCYYTSDPDKPFLLTFRNRLLAHYTNWINSSGQLVSPNTTNLPTGALVGGTPSVAERNAALLEYMALRNYIPTRYVRDANGYWMVDPTISVNPVPTNLANQYLVPNDSRIYKMKLALWRLTNQANSEILSRMNVGVAITYQHLVRNDPLHGMYNALSVATKNASPDVMLPSVGEGRRGYYGATKILRYGNAATYVTDLPGDASDPREEDLDGYFAGQTFMSQISNRGVLVGLYLDRSPGDPIWNSLSRATMYVPFNKFYARDASGNVNKTSQLDDFRSYMSGYEKYTGIYKLDGELMGMENRPLKDEFWASGLTLLSTAIYGGRNSGEGAHFPFHKGLRITNSGSTNGTNEYMIQYATTPKDNAGSTEEDVVFLDPSINSEGLPTGQAIGSVIDFFSPATTAGTNGADGLSFTNDTAGFFPVIGSCQSNWLIVFCSGIDAVPGYKPEEAVRRLFENTRTMRGRRLEGNRWVENSSYAMDSGVRTLVVGFLPEEKSDEEPEIKAVRATLKAMAEEGDPILLPDGTYVKNVEATPEIASDVPGLIKAFNNVLRRIYVEKMGSGTVSLPAVIDNTTDPDVRVVFGAAYRINPLDQWNGWLGKYYLNGTTSTEEWEANSRMLSRMNDREIYTSSGSQNSNNTAVQVITPTTIQQLISPAVPNRYWTPFRDWLLTYGNTATSDAVGILGDMVNSGITVVGTPKHKDLSSSNISAIRSRDAAVYIQTNRGVLHALNYMNGNELWAFIPPNIFQNKIRNLKFDTINTNEWLAGNGLTRVSSNPMVLLDGMLIARDVVYQGTPRTLLTGYLGNGGNGFYTMDITEMDGSTKAPVFRWAIENARYDIANDTTAPNNADRIKRWGIATTGGSVMPNYNYTDLGLTINPGVYFDPVDGETVGVLPGGLGHKLQDPNDTQGKAFYIFNPTNGAIIRKIDSSSNASTGFEAPVSRKLGMAISPVIYQENGAKKTIAFYTADSEGNILQCKTETASQNWTLKSIFQLRTLGGMFQYEGNIALPPAANLPVAVPMKMLLAKSRNNFTWLFGGTSNLYAPGSDADERKRIINGEQFIFGLNTNNIMKSSELNTGITPSNGAIRKMRYYIDDIPQDKYGKYGTEVYNYDPDLLGVSKGMDDYGWVLRLRPKFGVSGAEYLSANPLLLNNILYLATFIPFEGTRADEICSDVGVGKLYALDPSTGLSAMENGKSSIILDNMKIVGLTGNRDNNRLVLSAKELRIDSKSEVFDKFANAIDIGNGLFEVDGPAGTPFQPVGGDPELDFEELLPHIQYWRERFQ